ncbi:hypothetical protein F2P56_024855 [Juglans regia]|uniref:Uncharacterized protein LOC108986845 n=2 Tax=Juglans regia TaxID=51240 RepID=A0A2I4E6Z2_JUGRE|nr:uncharacterized protein LOC108986845 [Juglans regia]XP_018815164.2 uncharacterized protein LOC108986845 [Juglans regia]XP_018815165.2 uncharacterized protein LOC108986845 [Juglans regia]XP_018815166.2 uncharacterized protein LOC108986845 [Juglans regia]XP_018815167.2 uncharacterized protein LOC108986845 [Juglans regia]KAF5455257.1 hypothetical protein F2P56_024855 [Juglans regia]
MEAKLTSMEEMVRKLTEEIGALHQEDAAFKQTNEEMVGGGEPSRTGLVDSQRVPANPTAEEERRKKHLVSTDLPYNMGVMAVPLPTKFKIPQIEVYDETEDSLEYLETFKTHMTLHSFPGEIACRVFPLTLKGPARAWFESLSLGILDSFDELACLFMTWFMASRKRRRSVVYHLTVKQRDRESMKSYLSQFN